MIKLCKAVFRLDLNARIENVLHLAVNQSSLDVEQTAKRLRFRTNCILLDGISSSCCYLSGRIGNIALLWSDFTSFPPNSCGKLPSSFLFFFAPHFHCVRDTLRLCIFYSNSAYCTLTFIFFTFSIAFVSLFATLISSQSIVQLETANAVNVIL